MDFIIDSDLHIHSYLSKCASNMEMTVENILGLAQSLGYKKIAITDHVWDSSVKGAPPWYQVQSIDYIKQLLPLPSSTKTKVLFGGEFEFTGDDEISIFDKKISNFNFIVVPINHLHMKGVTVPNTDLTNEDYGQILTRRLKNFSKSKVCWNKVGLAHLTWTFLTKYSVQEIFSNVDRVVLQDSFKRIADNGGGIELNACCFTGEDTDYEYEIYNIAKKCGCKFYVASDAHSLAELKNAKPKLEKIVKTLNLKQTDKFIVG